MAHQLEADNHEKRLTEGPPDSRAPVHFERRIIGRAKHLRRSCGTCVNYMGDNGSGECGLYEDMPVLEGDLCPQYERGKGQLLIGGIWLAAWVLIAIAIALLQLL